MSFLIIRTRKSDADLQSCMAKHYSQPRGFVGRQLFYGLGASGVLFGFIAFGSATKFLPGRPSFGPLNAGLNNIFFHVEKHNGRYPCRNFTTAALLRAEERAATDYERKYGDRIAWFETLVELPRTGELYRRAGYDLVGQTKGFTCKRTGGIGTDNWSGARVWDTKNLRPKHVFVKPR